MWLVERFLVNGKPTLMHLQLKIVVK
jgi:hypothetical protein